MGVLAIALIACSCGESAGYLLTGTVEGAADGDTVYLKKLVNQELVSLDKAVIEKGTFTFKGVQDSAVNRYLVCSVNGEELLMDLFLEKGTIQAKLTKDEDSATGTPCNDAYQEIRSKVGSLNRQMNAIYEVVMGDTAMSQEEREQKIDASLKLEKEINQIKLEGITKNITNAVGMHLFKQNFYIMEAKDSEALLQKIPAQYQNDPAIAQIKEITKRRMQTLEGQIFHDVAMANTDGQQAKLSDYVGKGKIVLVDFWASWCGPCRQDMPELVAAYAKYKSKGLEIVGVSLDQNESSWKEAIKTLGMTWPQLSDLKGWGNEAAQEYAVTSIPHTVLLDANGTILARGLRGEALNKKLAELLK